MYVDRTEELRKIKEEILALSTSPLYAERTENKRHPVIGEGSHWARVMFIGEAPGRNEAASGRPFVGAAGKILDQLLASVEVDRKDVYITNIVKDRPPHNRDPVPAEIDAYGPFLDRQIAIIQPEILVPLGRYAMGYIMQLFGLHELLRPISVMHGRVFEAMAAYGRIRIIPQYHPAVSVYNASTKAVLLEDFSVLKSYDCTPKSEEA